MHSFHIAMTEKVKQEVDAMCNLSQGLIAKDLEEGQQKLLPLLWGAIFRYWNFYAENYCGSILGMIKFQYFCNL